MIVDPDGLFIVLIIVALIGFVFGWVFGSILVHKKLSKFELKEETK